MTEPTHDIWNWQEPDWPVFRMAAEVLTWTGDDGAVELLLRRIAAGAWLAGAEACVDALNRQAPLVPPAFVQEIDEPAGYAGRPDFFGDPNGL